MRACTYCRKILSAADSVCPEDHSPTVEVQPEALPADVSARFAGFQPFAWGGTGTLYLGLHAESGQMALLKLLSASLTAEATERARHHRELRKQLGFAYPHLPRVFEAGESAGRIWFLRQFVSGESLLVRLRLRGALRTPAALAVIAQLASSLDALHRLGLVHRDLEPGHVLFRTDNTGAEIVQLIDAGIPAARGTPAYTAPEIVEGGQATFRSDLYALGCLACELLTGTQPFARSSPEATLAAQRTEPAPELDAAIPAAVRTLIGSLLSKDPRRRPFSAQQVRRSLEPFLPDTVPPAPASPRSTPPPPPPEALGHAADGVKHSSPPLGALGPAADGVKRSSPPLGALGPAPVASERPKPSAPPLSIPSPAANGGVPARRTAPPIGASGAAADSGGRNKRSAPPPPPPEALGATGDKRRGSAPPVPVVGAGAAANGGEKLEPSKRPVPPDATMELRAEELEPASTYVALVDADKASQPAPRSVAPGIVREPPAARTEELDLDALSQVPATKTEDARAAQKLPSRVPTQRPSTLSAPKLDADDSAPTIAIDLSVRPAGVTPRVDELGEAARASSRPPPGAGASEKVAGAKPSDSPPAAATSVRSRKSTQMGMGPVRVPSSGEPDGVKGARTQSGLAPAGPAQVRIPSTFESASAAADLAAITQSGGSAGAALPSHTSAARTSLPPVREAEASLGAIDLMDPNADQERTLRAARRAPLSQRPSILLWAAAALFVLAIGLRLARGRGPERASSTSVTVRVPEAEPVAVAPQPSAAETAVAQPSEPQAAEPQLAAAEPAAAPAVAAQAAEPQPSAAAPVVPAPAPNPATEQSVRDEAPIGGNTAPPAVPTVTAAQAGKGFLREPGAVGAGGVVPYRARPTLDSDFKAKARQLYQEGKFHEAADAYQKASVRTPSDPAAFAGLGASWLAVGDADRAIAAYQRAVQLRPEVSGFHAALGRAYLSKGDRPRALAAYNKALELDPDNQAARTGAAALRLK